MGMIVPIMGKSAKAPERRSPGLADVLFSKSQQRVLGALFGQPDRSFYATQLIGHAEGGHGAVQRELAKLEAAGLVTTRRVGNQKHYQANPDAPIFHELCGISQKTFGVADVLRAALAPLADRITLAFIYGSIAKGGDTAHSDVDLMVIAEKIAYPELIEALSDAETRLGRPVNPTLFKPREMQRKLAEGNAFLERVLKQPRILLLGTDNDIRESRESGQDRKT
jgi:predicted nucleotidyltransferase